MAFGDKVSILFVILIIGNEWSTINGFDVLRNRQRRSGVSDQLMAHYGARQLLVPSNKQHKEKTNAVVKFWKEYSDRALGSPDNPPENPWEADTDYML